MGIDCIESNNMGAREIVPVQQYVFPKCLVTVLHVRTSTYSHFLSWACTNVLAVWISEDEKVFFSFFGMAPNFYVQQAVHA